MAFCSKIHLVANQCGNSSVVEHLLAKEGVASSNLVFRSFLCFVKETEIPASIKLAGIFYFRIYSFFRANPSIIPS